MKTIKANGTTYKLGRNASVAMGPHFRLKNYLKQGIPAPPAAVNYASSAQAELGNIYLNDTLGDCLVPDTQVLASGLNGAMRVPYSGPVVTLNFQSGKRLTVTPNHAVLTPRGFVLACLLKHGDDVVGSRFSQEMASAIQADFDKPPASAEDKFVSLLAASDNRSRKAVPASIDLNGDQRFINGDIDVIGSEGFLEDEINPSLSKPNSKRQIRPASELKRTFSGSGSSFHGEHTGRATAFSGIGGNSSKSSFFGAHSGVAYAEPLGLGTDGDSGPSECSNHAMPSNARSSVANRDHSLTIPVSNHLLGKVRQRISLRAPDNNGFSLASNFNASGHKPTLEGSATDPELFRKLNSSFPGLISTERITEVGVTFFDGHVYDFSTDSHWYIANEIITHNCVIACMAHLGGVFLGNAGGKLYLTSAQIIDLYSAIGGYIPGDPNTDQGADIQTALNYWVKSGLLPTNKPPHKIKAWMAVDPTNIQEMQTAIWLFENLVFGVNLPDAWVNPFPSSNGFVWDVAGAPDNSNGHCICGVGFGSTGYSHKGIEIATWGMLGNLTYEAIAKYLVHSAGGELYTVLSQEILDKAKLTAPAGLSWDQLQADFTSMG